ncbi:MAG: hypothetical protein ACOCNX_00550 [Prevotella sp.]
MTFYQIVEKWCEQYKYMRHHPPDNIRFMFTDSWQGMIEMAKGISNMQSPCVVMESAVEGDGPIRRPLFNYPIYFFVRAGKMADGNDAMIAKFKALQHARNFISYVVKKHEEELNEGNMDGDFARIDLDNVQVSYQSIGPLENGWFAVMIQLQREEPINFCGDEGLYDDLPSKDDKMKDDKMKDSASSGINDNL